MSQNAEAPSVVASGSTWKTLPRSLAQAHLLRLQRRHAFVVMVAPLLGTAALVCFRFHVTPFRIGLFAAMYVLSVLGISLGFHRLLAHGAFTCSARLRAGLVALGCLAAQGPPILWVANHRLHHASSDEPSDPHSPHNYGAGTWSRARAFWHAHAGWMLTEPPAGILRYAPDLLRDRAVCAANRRYLAVAMAGLALPALLGWAVLGGVVGFADGLLWGGLARIFVVHHVTWCVNSVCHVLGTRPFEARDQSRNNLLLGLLAFGEGWHNNHHAAPSSAAHGLRWWQVDISYLVLRLLKLAGLVSDVRLADRARLEARRGRRADGLA